MNVLVTGGSGLVGRFVVDRLALKHRVAVLDLKPPHRDDVRFHRVDLLNIDALADAVGGYEAVVHLAGIPHPLNHPADVVFTVNTSGTFNLLEVCAAASVPRFIYMSSESTLGFAFSRRRMWPLYLPIDELHPTRPQDPYGLSKLASELLCAGYSRGTGMETLCLRAPWIWVPEPTEIELYRQLVREWQRWWKNLWAFVHVVDVAEAIAALLEYRQATPHDIFFIAADENWTGKHSRDLAAEFYPETQDIRDGFSGPASFISTRKARESFGFVPKHGVGDILT